MNDQIVGTIRTLAQVVAGWLVAQAIQKWGVEVDAAALEVALVAVATGAYRALVTGLARKWPALEWLNGWASRPMYDTA